MTEQKSTRKRKTWISVANVISCFGVIVLHCNSAFWNYSGSRSWMVSNFIETFFYFPVPIFFIISGVTLLNYRERYSTLDYFKKRIIRTLIPFLFWSVVSIVYRYCAGWQRESIPDMIYGILNAKYVGIYWFFIPLFSVYLSVPLLSAISDNLRKKVFAFTAAAAFVINALLPTVSAVCKQQHFENFTVSVAGGYIIFVLLGYLVDNTDLKPGWRAAIYCLAASGWLIHFAGTAILSAASGEIDYTFKGYTNFPAVMQAAGVAIALKNVNWEKLLGEKILRLINTLSQYSFGIYLIHYYIIEQVPLRFGLDTASLYWRFLAPLPVFLICAAICFTLSKVPVLKKTIGL